MKNQCRSRVLEQKSQSTLLAKRGQSASIGPAIHQIPTRRIRKRGIIQLRRSDDKKKIDESCYFQIDIKEKQCIQRKNTSMSHQCLYNRAIQKQQQIEERIDLPQYDQKGILTLSKKQLQRYLQSMRIQYRLAEKNKLIQLQIKNIKLQEKINLLVYGLRQMKLGNDLPLKELTKNILQYEPGWKEKAQQAILSIQLKHCDQVRKIRDNSKALQQQLDKSKLTQQNLRARLMCIQTLVSNDSEYQKFFRVHSVKVSNLVNEYLSLRTIQSHYSSAVQRLRIAEVQIQRLSKQVRLEDYKQKVEEYNLLAAQKLQLDRTVLRQQRQLSLNQSRIETLQLKIAYMAKHEARLAGELQASNATIKSLKDWNAQQKENEEKAAHELNSLLYIEGKQVQKIDEIMSVLQGIQKKKEQDLLSPSIMGRMMTLGKDEVVQICKEKVFYSLYLSEQEGKLRNQIISKLKHQLVSLKNMNSNLGYELARMDKQAMAEKMRSQSLERVVSRLTSGIQSAIATAEQLLKRIRANKRECFFCEESKTSLGQINRDLSFLLKEKNTF